MTSTAEEITTKRHQSSKTSSRRHDNRDNHEAAVKLRNQNRGPAARRRKAMERERCGFNPTPFKGGCDIMRKDHDGQGHNFVSRIPAKPNMSKQDRCSYDNCGIMRGRHKHAHLDVEHDFVEPAHAKDACGHEGCGLPRWEHALFEEQQTPIGHDFVEPDTTEDILGDGSSTLYPEDYVRLGD